MSKKLFFITLSFVISFFFSAQLFAENEIQVKGYTYLLTDDGNAMIQKYSGSSSKLVLPTEIDGHPITAIAERAFINNQKLKKVTVSASITTVGDAAFAACPRLMEILVDPANEHFSSVDGALFSKDETTLLQCPAGKKELYFVPVGTHTIGNYAFFFCQKLSQIYIPEGITQIGNNAFESTLIQRIELPESIQELGGYLFVSCNNLQVVRIPEKCYPVINYESIAEGGRADITKWEYNSEGRFVAIEGYSIDGTFDLSQTDFVQKEGDLVSDRQGLVYSVKNGREVSIVGYKYQYPDGKGKAKKTSRKKMMGKGLVIPSVLEGYPVTEIAERAFFCTYGMEGVVIPDSVTSIGNSAFMYCTSLTNVVIPKNVTNIAYGAFRHCNSLTNITLGKQITEIGDYAFSGCSNLLTLNLPNSVTQIREGVFRNCANLQRIYTGKDLASIGKYAFEGCTHLSFITIDQSLTNLQETFETCAALEYFDVSPDNSYFSGRDGVLFDKAQSKIIRYPRGNRDVERELAEKSKKPILLGHYTIPFGITNIGTYAFSRSFSLTNIVIPASVSKMEPYAFYMCTNLLSITIPDTIPSIPPGAFARCIELRSADIGTGVTHIYPFAFSSCRSLTALRFKGDAPDNSDGFIDDWHRITVYHRDGSEGWNTLNWNDKSKRLWNPSKVLQGEAAKVESEEEAVTPESSESESKKEKQKDDSIPSEPVKE